MSTRINLAPEVYQQRQTNKQHRRIATSLAVAISGAALGLVAVLLIIVGGQSVYLTAAKNTISNDESKLQSFPDLVTAVTIQQDLTSLTTLQSQHYSLSKFFTVMQQATPVGISLSQMTLDTTGNLQANGTASNYGLVTKLSKALEASNVTIGPTAASTNQPYFSNVTVSGVSDNGQGGVGFQLGTQVASEVTSGQ